MDDEASIMLIVITGTLVIVILALVVVTFTVLHTRRLAEKDSQHKMSIKDKELELLKAVIDSQEAEREKIALNLHDEVGPLLSSIKFKLSKYKKDYESGKLSGQAFTDDNDFIDAIIQNVRGVSHDLSPQHVVKFGLFRAIESFTSGLNGIDFMVVSELDEEARLSKSMSRNLYCIIMELINNIIKHDNATWMEVEFFEEDSEIKVRINHDGQGVTKEQFDEFEMKSTGLGLSSIKTRLLLLDGRLNFSSINGMSNTEIVVPFD